MFYNVVKGDRWGVPGMEQKENQPPEGAAFDVNQWIDAPSLEGLTQEQRRLVMEARRRRTSEPRRQRQPEPGRQQPGSEFETGGGRRGGGPGPGSAGEPVQLARQDRPPGSSFPPGPSSPGFGPAMGFNPEFQQQQQQNIANINLAAEFPLPNGEFDPREPAVADITGWVHDTTVQPGVTYRYCVRYKLRNPLYNANFAKNPEDAKLFALASAASEWTQPVSIPALTSFFLAAGFDASRDRSVRFEVFKFQDGVLHREIFTAGPGDSIGRVEKSIDFTTGWTVVDLRRSGLRASADYVVVADNAGRQQRRFFNTDRVDPEATKLREQLKLQAPPAGG
ncbi:MAG: hypothetical protein RMJ35_11710 [Phycisphaerales bacterium]|nr:hypothetical protein [Phycisphaerales bacterium]